MQKQYFSGEEMQRHHMFWVWKILQQNQLCNVNKTFNDI